MIKLIESVDGVVMMCNTLGIIDEIAYPKNDVPLYFEVGENFLYHVEPECLTKALSFMQQLVSQKFASNIEVNFKIHDVIETIYLTGFYKDGAYMVIANTRIEGLNALNDELMKINSEQINTFRNILKETLINQENKVKNDTKNRTDYYDEISKLNNELLNTQRELAQKNQLLSKLNSELERLATRDVLTGLYNRRLLDEKLQDEMRRAIRLAYPLCMAVIDINHFKKVNDQLGHAVGDALLVELSKLILDLTRESLDTAFRIGGDEFLVLFANCDKKNAENILKRINESFISVTEIASLAYGVIELDEVCEEGLDRCIMKADALMFENKKLSR